MVGDRAFECAADIKVVLYELTTYKFTFDESGVRKTCSAKSAVVELAADKVNAIEQAPIPFNISKRAIGEVSCNVKPITLKIGKFAELKILGFPIDRFNVVTIYD